MNYEELDIIDKLKIQMVLQGYTQSDLANELEVSQSLLSLILSRKHDVSDKLKTKIKEIIF